MTEEPTRTGPNPWRDCPAFKDYGEAPTPAPGESDTCPTPAPTQPPPPTRSTADPIITRVCAEPDPPDDPYITERQTQVSPLIVVGTVRRVLGPRWTTADGRRPTRIPDPDDDVATIIVTPVELEVEQYVKGQRPQSQLLLWAFGGTIGQDVTDACGSDAFTFKEGQRVVVFLEEENIANGKGNAPIFGVIVRYAITAADQATVDGRSVPFQQLIVGIRAATANQRVHRCQVHALAEGAVVCCSVGQCFTLCC